jgi:hypothetical protein
MKLTLQNTAHSDIDVFSFLICKFSRREDFNDKSNAIYVEYNEYGCGYSCKHFSAHDSHFISASPSVWFRVKKWRSSPGRVLFGWFHISREPAYEFAAQRTAMHSESLLIKRGTCYHKSAPVFYFFKVLPGIMIRGFLLLTCNSFFRRRIRILAELPLKLLSVRP